MTSDPSLAKPQLDMRCACSHVVHMSKMIQIRNVPDEVHRALKVRAARAGMSLSDYLLREVTKVVERPTLDDFFRRVRRREPVVLDEDPAVTIRKLRGPMP
jgi:antitoxin FitA